MEFQELPVPGFWLLTPSLLGDERRHFRRAFCTDECAAHGLAPETVGGDLSRNLFKGATRRFHCELDLQGEAATLTCVAGKIFNVAFDLLRGSPGFLRSEIRVFDAAGCKSARVSESCANGIRRLPWQKILLVNLLM
jgi:dTDP-4-dehydrorhamnose 3,5-epimerase